MRIFYLLLDLLLKITLWIYYPRFKHINVPKKEFSRTIFMSNHAASFMDPLVIAAPQKPIVFFMTRSDVFKWWLKPVLWGAHMLPIYRQLDGKDTKAKNEAVFKRCNKILNFGRNLLVFSEGFTDNTFVRRLKPVKKGAIRIGFTALDDCNWKKKIYLQAVGINYTDRNLLGSGCVVSYGDAICLNNYKKDYEDNPGKAIHMLTKKMEQMMRNQLTDIRDEKMTSFHENIMRITRKGMNAKDSNKSIPLLKRWQYSKDLATWFNTQNIKENEELMQLKKELEVYFLLQKRLKIEESALYKMMFNQRRPVLDYLQLILTIPFVLLSWVHTYLPVKLIKNFVEKTFRRSVFWPSVKMLVGFLAVGFYNCILFILLESFTSLPFWGLFIAGIFILPLLFTIEHEWKKTLFLHLQMRKMAKTDLSGIVRKRIDIAEKIERLIPIKA